MEEIKSNQTVSGEVETEMPVYQAEETETAEKKCAVSFVRGFGISVMHKMKGMAAGLDKKKAVKIAIAAAALVVAVSVLVICVGALTNNYKTPIKTLEKYSNLEEYDLEKAALDYGNGLARKEWKQIYKILHNSDVYLDVMENMEKVTITTYEEMLDEYGENYSVTYKEIDKLELEKSELRDYKTNLQNGVEIYQSIVDAAEDFSSSDWSEMADTLDLTKAQTKELVDAYAQLVEELGRLQVTEGYEVELAATINGSELDEPETEDITVIVLKVNGRWIRYEDFAGIFNFTYRYIYKYF